MWIRFRNILSVAVTLAILAGFLAIGMIAYFSYYIPDYKQLSNYEPPIVTRLYASDGRLLEEYAKEKRVFVPIGAIPKHVIQAFIAAEDRNFYNHPGVDFYSVIRASIQSIFGDALVGGSTITQQVAKNFLLTNERSFSRKVREAILAFRMSSAFTKDRILELYLNEIFLGNGSYGVAVAALNYFNKSLEEITIEEAALLAALPKGPAFFDPNKNMKAALERRNYVLEGMYSADYITKEEYKKAKEIPIILRNRDEAGVFGADFFAEEVRRDLVKKYGDKVLYEKGLTVHTTVDPYYQRLAEESLRKALISYDKRHGYRGPIAKININDAWAKTLENMEDPEGILDSKKAVVLALEKDRTIIGFEDGSRAFIPWDEMKWARRVKDKKFGPAVAKPSDVLAPGDVVLVQAIEGKVKDTYSLNQIPEVNGSIVVIDPHTGKVLAMMGGYYYGKSQYNRATQALRQPGSAFKPFVYLSAMEHGFTPVTIVEDEPISLPQGPGLPMWTPKNYSGDYLGPIPLHVGLEKSRNLITVRLAATLGIERIAEIAKRFGINDKPQLNYSMVLGAAETTLLKLTTAYSMIANGGIKITPSFIERIHDRNGILIYRHDNRECSTCQVSKINDVSGLIPPNIKETKVGISDSKSVFQVITMMQGVVQRGTAAAAAKLGKNLAGKTGTTNDSRDSWFIGFSPDLVVGVFIGFDQPASLGARETGASVALPAFIDFMGKALKDKPNTQFKMPKGVKMMEIEMPDGKIGIHPMKIDSEEINAVQELEKFMKDASKEAPEDDMSHTPWRRKDSPPIVGTGGIY